MAVSGGRELRAKEVKAVPNALIDINVAGANLANINKVLLATVRNAKSNLVDISCELLLAIEGLRKNYGDSYKRYLNDLRVILELTKLDNRLTKNKCGAADALKHEIADVMEMLWDDKVPSYEKQTRIENLKKKGEEFLATEVLNPFVIAAVCVVVGAVLGGVVGFFLGGIGAVPCAMLGAYIGATVGLILGSGTALTINLNTKVSAPKWLPSFFNESLVNKKAIETSVPSFTEKANNIVKPNEV